MKKLFDWFADYLFDIVSLVLSILPNSPFQNSAFMDGLKTFETIMANVNYFIPFGSMSVLMASYIGAVALYVAVRWLLRLANYID